MKSIVICLKFVLLSLFPVAILGSCSEDNKSLQDASVIRGYDAISEGSIMKLSDIAEGIDYVALETTDASMLGDIVSLNYCSNKIYVADRNGLVAVFDNMGRFISSFNREGRGPEEYNNIADLLPAQDGNISIMNRQGMLYIYKESGDFIEKRNFNKYDKRDSYASFVKFGNKTILTSYLMELKGENSYATHIVYLYDNSMNVIDSLTYSRDGVMKVTKNADGKIASISIVAADPFYITSFKEEGRIYYSGRDTIMLVNKAGDFSDTLSVDWGMYKVDEGGIDYFAPSEERNFITLETPFFETDQYMLFVFNAGKYAPEIYETESVNFAGIEKKSSDTKVFALFDKKTGELTPLARPEKGKRGFEEDLGGGPPFWPSSSGSRGELLSHTNAYDFMEIKAENGSKAATLAAMLSENDNPVISIVKLKEQ